MNRTKVFISYSHKDRKWLDLLLSHLKPLVDEGLDVWSDQKIAPGQEWPAEIEKSLLSAKVAVLLVSVNFLNSAFIQEKEVPRFLEPYRRGQLTILPVLISACCWEKKEISSIQSPIDFKTPLKSLRGHKKDQALVTIAEAIHEAWKQQTCSQSVPEEEASSTALVDLRELAARYDEMPADTVDACFRRAVSVCYGEMSQQEVVFPQEVFPQLPSRQPLGWPQLLSFFDDRCKPSPQLVKALEQQLGAPAPPAPDLSDSCTFLALVLQRAASWSRTTRFYIWSAFLAEDESNAYNQPIVLDALEHFRKTIRIEDDLKPIQISGDLKGDLKGDNNPIAAILDALLAWAHCNTDLPVLEIFAPKELLDAPWAQLSVRDASNKTSTLLKTVPFLLRPVDRLELMHHSNRKRLRRKIQELAAGRGQWCADDLACNSVYLSASLVESDQAAGIKRLKALPLDQAKREDWFSSLIQSMVPLAIWYRHGASRAKVKRMDHLKLYAMFGGFEHGDPICKSCVRYDEIARQRKRLITDPLAPQVVLMVDHWERTPPLTPQARGASRATSPSPR